MHGASDINWTSLKSESSSLVNLGATKVNLQSKVLIQLDIVKPGEESDIDDEQSFSSLEQEDQKEDGDAGGDFKNNGGGEQEEEVERSMVPQLENEAAPTRPPTVEISAAA